MTAAPAAAPIGRALRPLVEVDAERCSGCGRCVQACPQGILSPGPESRPEADPARAVSCLACGHCAAVCPADALRHSRLDPEGFPEAAPPPAPELVLALLRSRRSARQYRPEGVPRDRLEGLLEAARYAPTGHNGRELGCVAVLGQEAVAELRDPIVRFYRRVLRLVQNPFARPLVGLVVGRARVRELLEALPGMGRAHERMRRGEDPLFHGAPAVLLFHAPRGGETSEADCVIAADHVTLLAPSLGLGTCHIGYAAAALKRLPGAARPWGVPESHAVYAVLSVGVATFGYPRVVPRPAVPVQWLAHREGTT